MRALAHEMSYVEQTASAWRAAAAARRLRLARTADTLAQHRRDVELRARNCAVQVAVLEDRHITADKHSMYF